MDYDDDDDEEEESVNYNNKNTEFSDSEDEEDEEYVASPVKKTTGRLEGNQEEEEEEEEEEEGQEEDYYEEEDMESDMDEEENDGLFRKITKEMKQDILQKHHTELQFRNTEEVQQMAKVIRNIRGEIVDPFHRTIPILSKYEKARILGERARQLEEGAQPFVQVPAEIIDCYTIAEMELKEKAIPFIIERPLPNGGCEFWRICDLENLL